MKKTFFYVVLSLCAITLNGQAIIINNTNAVTLWDTDRTINDEVRISSCATLRITAQVSFGTNSSIIVEQGGRLEIDGGTLQSINQDDGWVGIQVYGNKNEPQPPYGHAYVGSYGGVNDNNCSSQKQGVALIRNAKISGVEYGIRSGQGFWSGASGGGVIIAQNSTFSNAGPYTFVFYKYTSDESSSAILDCTFDGSILKDYIETSPSGGYQGAFSYVSLYANSGLRIFRNNIQLPDRGASQRSVQFVAATQASYEARNNVIRGHGSLGNNDFGFVNYGFHPQSKGIRITDNEFRGLHGFGLLGNGTDDITFAKNQFKYGVPIKSIGLYGCTGFVIEENWFRDTWEPAVIQDCGVLGDVIYKNDFDQIGLSGTPNYASIQSQKDNRGLQIRCNTFEMTDKRDIAVTSGPGIPDQYGGTVQAHWVKSNKNIFSHSCATTTSDFHLNPGVPSIIYYHESMLAETPQCKSSTVANYTSIGSSECPSNIDDGIIADLPANAATYTEFIMNNGGTGSNGSGIGASNYSEEMFSSENPALNEIRSALMERTIIYNRYIAALKDSGNIEEAIEYLDNENNEDARMILIPILISEGRYNAESGAVPNAQAELYKMQESIPEISDYIEWYQFIIDVYTIGEGEFENLEGPELSFVQNIASSDSRMSYKARSILMHPNYGNVYDFPVEEILEYQSESTQAPDKAIAIYPNPSNGEVNIELPSRWNGRSKFTIRSLEGKVVEQGELEDFSSPSVFVDVSDWATGVYMVEVINTGGAVYYEKLIVE